MAWRAFSFWVRMGVETMYTGNKPLVIISFLLAIALTVPGCGSVKSYSGPELPPDEIAIIKPMGYTSQAGFFEKLFGPGYRLRIERVDGKDVETDFWMRESLAVKPGTHTLVIMLDSCTGGGGQYSTRVCRPMTYEVLSLEAEAGHTYHVRGSGSMYWIEDKESEEVVAGTKPE